MTLNIFFFNDTATTEIYTLSLHDALPISRQGHARPACSPPITRRARRCGFARNGSNRARPRSCSDRRNRPASAKRSEEHTSELQSRQYLVCRLLLEKKKINTNLSTTDITT